MLDPYHGEVMPSFPTIVTCVNKYNLQFYGGPTSNDYNKRDTYFHFKNKFGTK
jgi:hypothetical protein